MILDGARREGQGVPVGTWSIGAEAGRRLEPGRQGDLLEAGAGEVFAPLARRPTGDVDRRDGRLLAVRHDEVERAVGGQLDRRLGVQGRIAPARRRRVEFVGFVEGEAVPAGLGGDGVRAVGSRRDRARRARRRRAGAGVQVGGFARRCPGVAPQGRTPVEPDVRGWRRCRPGGSSRWAGPGRRAARRTRRPPPRRASGSGRHRRRRCASSC